MSQDRGHGGSHCFMIRYRGWDTMRLSLSLFLLLPLLLLPLLCCLVIIISTPPVEHLQLPRLLSFLLPSLAPDCHTALSQTLLEGLSWILWIGSLLRHRDPRLALVCITLPHFCKISPVDIPIACACLISRRKRNKPNSIIRRFVWMILKQHQRPKWPVLTFLSSLLDLVVSS